MSGLTDLTEFDKENLIYEIATRARTAKQLAGTYDATVAQLKSFVEEYKNEITVAREEANSKVDEDEPTPEELNDLWITKKSERLVKYQEIADQLYKDIRANNLEGSEYATALRELRSYMQSVANELGQLLHRGSGESGSDSLSVDIQGVSLDNLK